MRILLFIFSILALIPLAHAEPKLIFDCHASSRKIGSLHIELYQDEKGKLSSKYAFGDNPLYVSPWTTPSELTTPPERLTFDLMIINLYRQTFLDPNQVKLFQNIFVDGNNRFEVNLWKLMDENQKLLGYIAYAYGETLGCY